MNRMPIVYDPQPEIIGDLVAANAEKFTPRFSDVSLAARGGWWAVLPTRASAGGLTVLLTPCRFAQCLKKPS
jgi:hypothetical protein